MSGINKPAREPAVYTAAWHDCRKMAAIPFYNLREIALKLLDEIANERERNEESKPLVYSSTFETN